MTEPDKKIICITCNREVHFTLHGIPKIGMFNTDNHINDGGHKAVLKAVPDNNLIRVPRKRIL